MKHFYDHLFDGKSLRRSSGRRFCLIKRETSFDPRVGQIKRSCHQLGIDVIFYCMPWRSEYSEYFILAYSIAYRKKRSIYRACKAGCIKS